VLFNGILLPHVGQVLAIDFSILLPDTESVQVVTSAGASSLAQDGNHVMHLFFKLSGL
jgi:hypothetical protein